MLRPFAACLLAAILLLTGRASAQAPESLTVNVVGTPATLSHYARLEKPFFTELVPDSTGQRVRGSIKPANELKLEGAQLLRLLKQGVFDFVFALPSYIEDGKAIVEGAELAGLAGDIRIAQLVAEAWLPEITAMMREVHKAEVLATFALPEQTVTCRGEVRSLEELAGKKIRVVNQSQSDFVSALGAVPVAMSFASTHAALEKGSVDCAISSALSAYKAKWHELTGTLIRLPVGFPVGFLVANATAWSKLDSPTRGAIGEAAKGLSTRSWELAAAESDEGIACATGGADCPAGPPGRLKLVLPRPGDLALRDRAVLGGVLKEWTQRCGAPCTARWNDRIGRLVGVTVKPE